MIRALVVDDEPLARRRICRLLEVIADVEICGQAGSGPVAVNLIQTLRPDLVFLDIQMPEMSGFDVIAEIGPSAMPLTVCVTAFDAYAVQAFDIQALDYLLKPFNDARFAKVIDRARRQVGQGTALCQILQALPPRLIARSRGITKVIHFDEIEWISAAGDYAEVHLEGRSVLMDESLTSLATRLPPDRFSRIHRSAIVSLDRLRDVRIGAHGDGFTRLKCGKELKVSRRFRATLDAYFDRQPLSD